ncbi:hypothetical protein [Thalassobaculum sp.]|uniref:hypothetical protein n=1 Tax=Thalassobaculum sp. TaxID=2022740 RepID=UPI0032EEBF76
MRRMLAAAALLALGLLPAGCGSIDWRATVADLAGSACRGIGNCTVACGDGSTLDGRPTGARCPR